MSLKLLLEISRRSFRAANAGMNTVAQNVANANTDGYSRRRVTLKPNSLSSPGLYTQLPIGSATGAGVTVERYQRMRDQLLDDAVWRANTGRGGAGEEARLLSALEGIFAPGSGHALPDVLDTFWTGWGDLANNPTDVGVRTTVLHRADTLADTFHHLASGIERLSTDTRSALRAGVEAVNSRLQKIADLNATIREARYAGSPDLAAADARDRLVRELSAYAPVRVDRDDNGYTLTISGMAVVQGTEVTSLGYAARTSSSPATVRFGDSDVAFNAEAGGKPGAWPRTVNEPLPGVRAELDALAKNLVEDVNAAHAAGYDLDDDTGLPFFDPAGITASTISVAVTEPEDIAASGAAGQFGDNTQALAIADLRTGFDEAAIDLMAGIGAQVKQASARAEAQAAVVAHAEGMARGVRGVSLDEEMTNLIEYQQAFAASARVLSTAQQMMDTLLAI